MTAIVKTGGHPPDMPNYRAIEPMMEDLARLREEVAVATEPSKELLERLDTGIARTAASEAAIRRAAEPGGKIAVASYLAMLLSAYPNAGTQDAKHFGGFLHDDVMELAPPIAAVEIACRRWRQKSRFMPAISELLEDVKDYKSRVENMVEFIGRMPALRDRMRQQLG